MGNWTYSGDPRRSALDEVRALIADTDSTKPWTLLDSEINYAIWRYSAHPPVIGENFVAAWRCAKMILGKFKTIAQSKRVGDLSITYGNHFQFYQNIAYELKQSATLSKVKVYVGGISLSDKQAQDEDTDRVQPAGKVDGMNNTSSLPPVPGSNQF